jgi:hypothetical protein
VKTDVTFSSWYSFPNVYSHQIWPRFCIYMTNHLHLVYTSFALNIKRPMTLFSHPVRSHAIHFCMFKSDMNKLTGRICVTIGHTCPTCYDVFRKKRQLPADPHKCSDASDTTPACHALDSRLMTNSFSFLLLHVFKLIIQFHHQDKKTWVPVV